MSPPNARKAHDNSRVSAYLNSFAKRRDACEDTPGLADILTGAVHLKTEGHTATRPLSLPVIWGVLCRCTTITTEAVALATGEQYARAQVERCAAHARVASKALELMLDRRPWLEQGAKERRAVDAPFLASLAGADFNSSPLIKGTAPRGNQQASCDHRAI